MKSSYFLVAATTIMLSLRPGTTGQTQQPSPVPQIQTSPTTDSLTNVLIDKSDRSVEKAHKLVEISKVVKAQSEKIARQERKSKVAANKCCVEMNKSFKDTVIAKPIKRGLFYRLFHRRK